jgi:hypothetical protein
MHDRRLLGRWRSDASRTGQDLAARRDIPARQKAGLRGLFGKLELRYTRKRCFATLNGRTESFPYNVVAKDLSSVAIVSHDALLEQPMISHLHFDGSHMWVAVGTGAFRELFKRIQAPERQLRNAARGAVPLRIPMFGEVDAGQPLRQPSITTLRDVRVGAASRTRPRTGLLRLAGEESDEGRGERT